MATQKVDHISLRSARVVRLRKMTITMTAPQKISAAMLAIVLGVCASINPLGADSRADPFFRVDFPRSLVLEL